MEQYHNLSLSGKTVIAEANLRDETFWKLVADFYGSQAGLELNLDMQRCKNKLLIQVGLVRQDNNLTWDAVVEWLQKIFPDHQSAFFQGLIETGIATTLSLGTEARYTFLESEVNFGFVGPLCDSIGVERTALLEMRDFSEQARSIEVTNGLILELCNFVAREKLDPMVLVTWLRNFHPLYCKDGDIQKAYKVLRPRIKQLKLNYRNYKTRSYRRNAAMEMLIQSPFELVRKGQKLNTKKRFKKEISVVDEKPKVKEDNYEIFSTMQGEEMPFFDIHSHKGNIQVKVEVIPLSNDYNGAVNTDSVTKTTTTTTAVKKLKSITLLDMAMFNIQELSSGHGGKTKTDVNLSRDVLENQYSLTCKQYPDMIEFDRNIAVLAKDIPMATPPEFLHYNACFLLGVHDAIEQELMRAESEAAETSGKKLGRDQNSKFARFVDLPESATSRYIHMACDFLNPNPHDPVTGRNQRHWVAFCEEKGNPSELKGILWDELDSQGYFEAAAGLTHHHKEIPFFFSDLLLLNDDDCPNIVLESVNCDATDDTIQSLVCVLAVVYCKILGPYYQLLKSGGEYGLFSHYILCLYQKLLEWTKNPSLLMEPEEEANVFLQEPAQERTFHLVFQYCGRWHTNRDLIRSCLKNILKVIATVVDQHLLDFLPGGKYSPPSQEEVCIQIAGCPFSTLMQEYPFDNPYVKKNPEKHNAPEPMSSESSTEDSDSSDEDQSPRKGLSGAKRGRVLSPPNREKAKVGRPKSNPDDPDRPSFNVDRKYVMATVSKNGGPCKTQRDVDKLLLRFESKSGAEKVEALRCEILYQKMVLDNNDPNLDISWEGALFPSSLSIKLKVSLPRVKPGYSFVLAPPKTK